MRTALKLMLPAAALALGLAVSAAQAAPASTGLAPLKVLTPSAVEQTHWVYRCWHDHYGHKHCHRVWVRHYH